MWWYILQGAVLGLGSTATSEIEVGFDTKSWGGRVLYWGVQEVNGGSRLGSYR